MFVNDRSSFRSPYECIILHSVQNQIYEQNLCYYLPSVKDLDALYIVKA